jgi:hypothetical protein
VLLLLPHRRIVETLELVVVKTNAAARQWTAAMMTRRPRFNLVQSPGFSLAADDGRNLYRS